LELQRWKAIEIAAKNITQSDIEKADDGNYHVRSCTNSENWYDVDLHASHCTCPSYPLISFCKHLAAVQTHFSEACTLVRFPTAPTTARLDIHANVAKRPPLASANLNIAISPPPQQQPDNSRHFTHIGHKILDLASQAHENQLGRLTATLLDLEAGLDQAKAPLLKKVPVAPNQHSWPETAAVMIAQPKTRRKEHTDPYSGGERSGKRAKPDTRVARAVAARCALMSHSSNWG
jgi:hypothetical protein